MILKVSKHRYICDLRYSTSLNNYTHTQFDQNNKSEKQFEILSLVRRKVLCNTFINRQRLVAHTVASGIPSVALLELVLVSQR